MLGCAAVPVWRQSSARVGDKADAAACVICASRLPGEERDYPSTILAAAVAGDKAAASTATTPDLLVSPELEANLPGNGKVRSQPSPTG